MKSLLVIALLGLVALSACARKQHKLVLNRAAPLSGDNENIYGNMSSGFFYCDVAIGTPSTTFTVIFDTGSSDLLVPASSCSTCGKVNHYNPSKSSTSSKVTCSQDTQCTCSAGVCTINDQYGGGEDVKSTVYSDSVSWSSLSATTRFGAITSESPAGTSFPAGVDGILGMAYQALSAANNPTFFDSLVAAGEVDNVFSLCISDQGGEVTLGGIDYTKFSGNIAYTDITLEAWYCVSMEDLLVNGKSVGVDSSVYNKYHTIVDSGTTLFYIPQRAYNAMMTLMKANCSSQSLKGICDNDSGFLACQSGVSLTQSQIDEYPSLTVSLDNNVELTIDGNDYLVPVGGGEYCFGIQAGSTQFPTILGDVVIQNFYVVFDRQNSQIGFAELTSC